RGTFSIAAPMGTTLWRLGITVPPTPILTFLPTWKPVKATLRWLPTVSPRRSTRSEYSRQEWQQTADGLLAGGPESLGATGGFAELVLDHLRCEKGMLQQLRDL